MIEKNEKSTPIMLTPESAALLVSLLSQAAARGPDAKHLADLYERATAADLTLNGSKKHGP